MSLQPGCTPVVTAAERSSFVFLSQVELAISVSGDSNLGSQWVKKMKDMRQWSHLLVFNSSPAPY